MSRTFLAATPSQGAWSWTWGALNAAILPVVPWTAEATEGVSLHPVLAVYRRRRALILVTARFTTALRAMSAAAS